MIVMCAHPLFWEPLRWCGTDGAACFVYLCQHDVQWDLIEHKTSPLKCLCQCIETKYGLIISWPRGWVTGEAAQLIIPYGFPSCFSILSYQLVATDGKETLQRTHMENADTNYRLAGGKASSISGQNAALKYAPSILVDWTQVLLLRYLIVSIFFYQWAAHFLHRSFYSPKHVASHSPDLRWNSVVNAVLSWSWTATSTLRQRQPVRSEHLAKDKRRLFRLNLNGRHFCLSLLFIFFLSIFFLVQEPFAPHTFSKVRHCQAKGDVSCLLLWC